MARSQYKTWILSAACVATLVAVISAQSPSPQAPAFQDPPPATAAQDPADPAAGRGGRGANQAPRPYAQVITSAFKTDDGVFKVHRGMVGATDTVYFEIPKAELDKDFVWNVTIKKNTLGAGFGGENVSSRVVRWTKRGDRILLLGVDYSTTAEPGTEVAQAVADANYPSIIRTMPVAAYAANGDAVIDATAFFMDGVTEFQARGAVGGRGLAADRSFLEKATSFPDNINVESTLTFTGNEAAAGGGRGGGGAGGMRGSSGTVVAHHSIMKLPEKPMMQRNYDERVGFNVENLVDYGTDEHRSVNEQIITRFRLEKKDANAAMSEPVKPIVFYVDPATPAKWVPFVKRGIESWQPAFEAAGFRNAIQAKEAPPNDADWSAEDARYSIVRWVPVQAESQSLIRDPRSGEIISASVEVYPNVASFGPTNYFVQAGAVDKRASKLPLPDEITGELVRFQVAHGVGHALGLPHNTKASSTYTVAQVRDPKWVKDNSFVASIMDDARFNYVAQPEDGMDPNDLIPKIGPYDKFAVKWGYTPVPSATTPGQEKKTLDEIVKEQETKAYLRFSTEGAAASDPGDSNLEAVGDSDAVAATTLGMKNLTRVAAMVFPATSTKVGDPWEDLEAVYTRLVGQWSTEMTHVVKVVGGLESQQVHIGQQGVRFKTVPKLKQQEALNYVLANAFQVPAFMIDKEVLRRIEPAGAVARVRTAQAAVLTALLQSARIDRMTEQLTIDGSAIAYSPLQFLADVRNGVWSELGKGTPISIYRRNLQRSYLENMDQKLNAPGSSAEIRMLAKGELRALDGQLKAALAATGLDENTRRHLSDSREEIAAILDPRVSRPAADPAAAAAAGRGRGGLR
ncbi:MAG: DUF5117 domain-containing protein [Acidobacteria bacterium]|nr:MAG: DUF5117 domain-containing protein [Acidobacteriota bacterium]